MKKIIIVLMLMLIIPIVKADNLIDFNKKGNISIKLIESQNGEFVKGAQIELMQVARAKIDENSNLAYVKIDSLDSCNIDLSNLEKDNLKEDIEECTDNANLEKILKETDKNGIVEFDNLELGLYFVRQTNEVSSYSNINSYLLTIPTIIDNEWVYEIESEPKTEIIKLMDLTVNKVWKTNRKISDYVEIELVLNGEVIDTITLNKDNNWEYTWTRIPSNTEYEVREKNIPDGYTAIYEKNENNYTVINADILPQTGQHTYYIYLFGMIGLILVTVGIGIYKKSNK